MERHEAGRLEDTVSLVRAAQAGDSRALDALLRRHLPWIRQVVALRMGWRLRQVAEADDLVQDVLLRVLKGLERFEQRSEGGFRNWLARLVEHEVADQARHAGRRKRGAGKALRFSDLGSSVLASSILEGAGPSPSGLASAEDLAERLEEALLEMPAHHRELIILRSLCGMSYEEVAAELGIAQAGAVRVAFMRALKKLKDLAGLP
ncbi:MAG: sigma-70 family RNA polymerase sigma factor [Planctomycetes bacterium]|nr:sigma-70 family RNA polymerase sigma factor [Planctomycetota bacterium]